MKRTLSLERGLSLLTNDRLFVSLLVDSLVRYCLRSDFYLDHKNRFNTPMVLTPELNCGTWQ